MASGVQSVTPDADLALVPIADGGDGSVDAFVSAGFTRVPIVTRGPTGEPGDAAIALRGRHAVVELASACGMSRLPPGVTAPMTSTTHGLGDALRAALDLGADRLLVCLGGSASTDGGTGLLSALGATLTDADGKAVLPGGSGLGTIARLDLAEPRSTSIGGAGHGGRGRVESAERSKRCGSGLRASEGGGAGRGGRAEGRPALVVSGPGRSDGSGRRAHSGGGCRRRHRCRAAGRVRRGAHLRRGRDRRPRRTRRSPGVRRRGDHRRGAPGPPERARQGCRRRCGAGQEQPACLSWRCADASTSHQPNSIRLASRAGPTASPSPAVTPWPSNERDRWSRRRPPSRSRRGVGTASSARTAAPGRASPARAGAGGRGRRGGPRRRACGSAPPAPPAPWPVPWRSAGASRSPESR